VLPQQGRDNIESMFDDVYADVPWNLVEQRDQAVSEGRD
jgi:2-oxoisovalerate dehydrogenase E1 component alpha subunit